MDVGEGSKLDQELRIGPLLASVQEEALLGTTVNRTTSISTDGAESDDKNGNGDDRGALAAVHRLFTRGEARDAVTGARRPRTRRWRV